jgi:uncharacterized protein with PIN domain
MHGKGVGVEMTIEEKAYYRQVRKAVRANGWSDMRVTTQRCPQCDRRLVVLAKGPLACPDAFVPEER